MRSKASGRKLAPGDVVRYTAATSGGYGDPRTRAPDRVLSDWLDGFIDLETARDVYRVVIRPEDGIVDEAGTARMRAEDPPDSSNRVEDPPDSNNRAEDPPDSSNRVEDPPDSSNRTKHPPDSMNRAKHPPDS